MGFKDCIDTVVFFMFIFIINDILDMSIGTYKFVIDHNTLNDKYIILYWCIVNYSNWIMYLLM